MPNEDWDYFHLKPIRLDFSDRGLKSPEEPTQCQVENDIPSNIMDVQEGSDQQDVLARGLPRPSPPPYGKFVRFYEEGKDFAGQEEKVKQS